MTEKKKLFVGTVVNYLDGHWCLIKTLEKKVSGMCEEKVFVKLCEGWYSSNNMKPYTKARAASTSPANLRELSPEESKIFKALKQSKFEYHKN